MIDPHHRALVRMYLLAPINRLYLPVIDVTDGAAGISLAVSGKFHQATGAVDGSVCCKMLDDAAYYAASSGEREHVLLTLTFQSTLVRPVVRGEIRAEGRLVARTRTHLFAASTLVDADDEPLGRGAGVFVRSGMAWNDADGYTLAAPSDGEPA